MTAAKLSKDSHFFAAKIYLKGDYALFRLDISDDRLVMTREDPKWPAIICSSRSKFYASYHEEFRNEAASGRELDLKVIDLKDTLLAEHVNDLIASIGIKTKFTPDGSAAVVKAVKNPELPYA